MVICNKCIDLYSNTSDIYKAYFHSLVFFCPFTDAVYITLQFFKSVLFKYNEKTILAVHSLKFGKKEETFPCMQ